MQQLIIKKDIDEKKMRALLYFLKSWDIEAEIACSLPAQKKEEAFSMATGLWNDYPIDASELRKQAWNRNK